MRCYICNREDDGITWDNRHKDFGPCFTCQAVINEITYDKKDDDELVEIDDVGC